VNSNNLPISNASLLRTCLQVWQRKRRLRNLIAVEDRGLVEKVDPTNADVSLTIFGRNCGTVSRDFDRSRKVTTQMYLKLLHPSAFNALIKADFAEYFNRVAYTEALSIVEIRAALNKVIFGDELLLEVKSESGLFDETDVTLLAEGEEI
jgi:hypothetical protein